MGRGLAAILQVSGQHGDRPELRDIAVELIDPNPAQPRRRFDDDALDALAGSLAEHGVLQPVLVRPLAGGATSSSRVSVAGAPRSAPGIPVVPAVVERRDDASSLEAAIVENMAREDLNPVEEARGVAALVEELGLTREDVGRRVGRSRVAVSNLLRILDLPDDVLVLLEDGRLSEGHGRALLLAEEHAARRRLAHDAASGGWSVRVTEDRARAANDPDAIRVSRGRPSRLHPDQEAACEEIAEALSGTLGRAVRVRPRGTGYKVEIQVEDARTRGTGPPRRPPSLA